MMISVKTIKLNFASSPEINFKILLEIIDKIETRFEDCIDLGINVDDIQLTGVNVDTIYQTYLEKSNTESNEKIFKTILNKLRSYQCVTKVDNGSWKFNPLYDKRIIFKILKTIITPIKYEYVYTHMMDMYTVKHGYIALPRQVILDNIKSLPKEETKLLEFLENGL